MWKRILKNEIRSFDDARRAGREYALEDMYESMLLSEEEYQNLSNREKTNIHQNLRNILVKYGKDLWAEERKQFHTTMLNRVRIGNETTMVPSEDYIQPKIRRRRTKEEMEAERQEIQQRKQEREQRRQQNIQEKESRRKERESRRQEKLRRKERESRRQEKKPNIGKVEQKLKEREERQQKREIRSALILDYFTLWRNRYNRLPTLTEIRNSEGRPLTVSEEATYYEEYARRTKE